MQLYRYLEIDEINRFNSKTTDRGAKVAPLKQTHELPFEYVELMLCKLFSCLPSQLEGEDYNHLMNLLAIDNALTQYENWQNDSKIHPRLKIKLEILKLERQLENA